MSLKLLIVKLIFSTIIFFKRIRANPAAFFSKDGPIVYPSIVTQNGIFQTADLDNFKIYLINNSQIYLEILLSEEKKIIADLHLNDILSNKSSNTDSIRNNLSLNQYSCHFQGNIRNISDSFVAVSFFNGITGYIHFNQSIYFIEPESNVYSNLNSIRPHKLINTNKAIDSNFVYYLNNQKKSKQKRSLSKERFVKVAVIADNTMVKSFVNNDLEIYLLTIMNMVSSLFKDSSLENLIQISVVRLIFLEDEPFKVITNASATLENFCRYQKKINFEQSHPNHHDIAILVTKVDICKDSNAPCDTLGLASLGSMCDPDRSCNINEDTGLSLAFTIAHEIGHNFNAEHDTPESECGISKKSYLMNTHLNVPIKDYVWSECSRREIQKFMDHTNLTCLDDKEDFNLIKNDPSLPGLYYDFDYQCKFSYGANATHCKNQLENNKDECFELWCKFGDDQSSCYTKGEKPADGTLCGDGKNFWCLKAKCQPIEELKPPIDGGWGHWSDWSSCSRNCNGGIKYIERKCDNPRPSNNGNFCSGERRKYQTCNTQKCNTTLEDQEFKDKQCSKFNSIIHNNESYQWEFYNYEYNPCKLYCKPKGQRFFKYFNEIVQDGTSCSSSSNDICIYGTCKPVGCDWVIGSETKEDSCGICGGDDSGCDLYNGNIEVLKVKISGYRPLLFLPKSTRSINITKYSNFGESSYLAIKNQKGEYLFNGNFLISSSGQYSINQSLNIIYKIEQNKEYLIAKGPLIEDLYVTVLHLRNQFNVSYSYTLPNGIKNSVINQYKWKYDQDWSACNKPCGKGYREITPKCYESKIGLVNDEKCDIKQKPEIIIQACNTFACAPEWWVGEWQPCSGNCFNGGKGYRKRSIFCILKKPNDFNDEYDIVSVQENECNLELLPMHLESCEIDLNKCETSNLTMTGYWITGEWSDNCKEDPCTIETRMVVCSDPNFICNLYERPKSEKKCELQNGLKCGQWKVDKWSECDKSCDNGTRTRNVSCINGQICSLRIKPHDLEPCSNSICFNSSNISMENNEDDIYADVLVNISNSSELNFEKLLSREINMTNTTFINDLNKLKQDADVINQDNFPALNSTKSGSFIEDDYYVETSVNNSFSKKPIKTALLKKVNINKPNNKKISKSSKNNISKKFLKTTPKAIILKKDIKRKSFRSIDNIFPNQTDLDDDYEIFADIELSVPKNFSLSLNLSDAQFESFKEINNNSFSYINGNGSKDNDLINHNNTTDYFFGVEPIDLSAEEFEWQTGEFGQCSRTCGIGFRSRKVVCISTLTGDIDDDSYCHELKPSTLEVCNTQKCLDWNVTEWSDCSASCGPGIQTREIFCTDSFDSCNPDNIPKGSQSCFIKSCYEWIAEKWSPCSAECGIGIKTRLVYCFDQSTNATSEFCDQNEKPNNIDSCMIKALCIQSEEEKCVDIFSKSLCRRAFYSNRCKETYIKQNCCRTCLKDKNMFLK